jgi:hypothetical protein
MNWKCLSVCLIVLVAACTSKNSGSADSGLPEAGNCAMPGAAAAGPADTHCVGSGGMRIVQPTTTAGCYADASTAGDDGGGGGGGDAAIDAPADAAPADAATDAAPSDAGGDGNIGNCGDDRYGPTMYGTSGGDDDCKYDVSWTSTPICRNQPVYFTVTAKNRTDESPLTGANAIPDVVLNCAHPIPNVPPPSQETMPGIYTVGPIMFDMPGRWVFRFHFHEECMDFSPESPHGHAAFYVDVP